ncbi:MAG TPA: PfkB family carbohydrate kinase [Patescibacteria group bacterium]|nr:PfkB family carbohydrate kinase [Patescibacteria group bacterium]
MPDIVCCGAINWDINLFSERLPRTGEEVPVREIQRVSGGTAANVSVAAARILGRGRVAFIGALGMDEIAERQLEILEAEGVDSSCVVRVEDESGQAYITIGSGGENEIHTYFGANLRLSSGHISEARTSRVIEMAKVAVIMDPPLDVAHVLAEMASSAGLKVIWDPGVYAEMELDALAPTLEHVDYFILNHLEFENLLGTSESEKIGSILGSRKRGIKAIIKRGSEGCTLRECTTGTTIHVDAVPLERLGLEMVNTVGCGDAFIGTFAAAKVEGLDDMSALRRGCAAGSFKATRKETRGGPTAVELKSLLDAWSGNRT